MHQYYNPETKIWKSQRCSDFRVAESAIGDVILRALQRNTGRIAQIFADDGYQLTFEELHEMSIRVAKNLPTLGILAGDVVAVAGRNNKEIAAVVFGCFFIGVPVNTLDASFQKDDLAHMFGITKPKLVVCEASNFPYVEAAIIEKDLPAKILIFGSTVTSQLLKEVNINNFSPAKILDCTRTTAIIHCSSGTTGMSKAVCISHAQVNLQMVNYFKINATDTVLVFSSLYWVTGMATLVEATLNGAVRVTTEKQYSPELQLELMQRYKVTLAISPPVHLAGMLESSVMKGADLSSVRMVITGGSSVPEELRLNFENQLPNGIVRTMYGMTEVGGVTSTVLRHKSLSVGQLTKRLEAKIIDDEGNSLGPNQQGHVVVKPPVAFIEYMGDPEQTKEAKDPDGWVYTGDLGYFDNDAFLFIVGRSKEIIKYRGYQISPAELEEFLQKETGIKQVCVIGIEDKRNGTDLPAAVFLDTGDNQMSVGEIKKIAEAKLPDYKQLRGGVYFVEKFPMTPSGKIKRRVLKEIIHAL